MMFTQTNVLTKVLLNETIPQQEDVIAGILSGSEVMVVQSMPKNGKSIMASQIGMAIAAGKSVCGMECNQGKVLYVNLEQSPELFMSRLQNLAKKLLYSEKDLENLHILNLQGWCQKESYRRMRESIIESLPYEILLKRIAAELKKTKYKAVIIDSINSLLIDDETDPNGIFHFYHLLQNSICEKYQCAAVLVRTHIIQYDENNFPLPDYITDFIPSLADSVLTFHIPKEYVSAPPKTVTYEMIFDVRSFPRYPVQRVWFANGVFSPKASNGISMIGRISK